MSDMSFEELRTQIEAEIAKCVKYIGTDKERVDMYMKQQVDALVGALDIMNEVEDIEGYKKALRQQYRAHRSGAMQLHRLLLALDVKHQYP